MTTTTQDDATEQGSDLTAEEMIFEWRTGHHPDTKLSELAREWEVSFAKINVPYDKSRGRELTYNELEELLDTPRGESHLEWRKPWEVRE